ncbi:zinc ribbon domain-containing protein [Syntrophomonas sp.]|uniref:FmdB family zinc ribbon protein n=1 Tax=Syntrophomonas sp. TaxID=2053627 RepID=UPI003457878B
MPIFDFQCQDCGKSFDKMLSYIDKDKVRCPQCDSSNLKQLLSSFNTTRWGMKTNKVQGPDTCGGCSNSGCPMRF